MDAAQHFVLSYPDVRIALTIENRRSDLLTEDIDVAIRIGALSNSELIARKLGTMGLWLCASPSYLADRGTPITIDDMSIHTVISHFDRRDARRMRTPSGEVREFVTDPGTVVPEPAVAKVMLMGGVGIGWLPDFEARDAIASGSLVRVLPDHEADGVEVHALYPSHRSLSAKVRVFIDALVEHMSSPICDQRDWLRMLFKVSFRARRIGRRTTICGRQLASPDIISSSILIASIRKSRTARTRVGMCRRDG